MGNFVGPDLGTTKFGERAGASVTAGLAKDNPFPTEGCDFGDSKCLVGAGCSKTGVIYEILCEPCNQGDQGAGEDVNGPRDNRRPQRAEVVAGSRRRRYLGQTGTSMHRRQVAHKSGKGSAINKHTKDLHSRDQHPPKYTMKAVKGARTVLSRIATEGVFIDEQGKEHPNNLMNSRGGQGGGRW